MSRLTPRTRFLLLAILLAAWAWRLSTLGSQSLWRDEMDSLRFATRPLAQLLATFTRPGENGPLYFLSLRPWLAFSGHSEYALRFPSAFSGLLALPLLYAWGRRLLSPGVALLATALLAVNPYHLWYSQEARMYAPLMVVVLLALWAFAEALDKGGWWRWLLWFILTSTCFYLHVLGVLVIPLQGLWFLLVPRWRRRWLAYGSALAALILPYVPLVWWQWKLLVDPNFRTGHLFVPLGRMLVVLFSAQIQGILPGPGAWIFAPAIFLLLAALFLSPIRVRARQLLLSWWLLPPVGVFLISLGMPIFTDRYLIWTLPALVLLLALGAGYVAGQSRGVAVVLVILLVGIQLWAGWRQMSRPIKSDFRAAAAYVAPRRAPDDLTLFLIPYIRFTYRYYDPGPYPWADAPYANRNPDASLLPDRLRDLTAGYGGVWLIESEGDFYDRQGLLRAWLGTHGRLDDEAHFVRVDVYHYRLLRK